MSIAYDHSTAATIGSFQATCPSPPPGVVCGAFTYSILRPTAPLLTETELSIDGTNGELTLALAAAKGAADGPVAVNIQAKAGDIDAAATFALMIEFHNEVAFSNPPPPGQRIAVQRTVPPDDAAGVVVYDLSQSNAPSGGGNGDYEYRILDAAGMTINNAGELLAFDNTDGVSTEGALTLLSPVTLPQDDLLLTVEVKDMEGLGGSATVEMMFSWQALAAVDEDKRLFVLGGTASSSDGGPSPEVWVADADKSGWQRVSQAFPARNTRAAVLGGTIFISGGSNDGGVQDDVWASGNNGVSWSQMMMPHPVNAGQQVPVHIGGGGSDDEGRFGHAMVNYGGTLHIIGGQSSGAAADILWSFTDSTPDDSDDTKTWAANAGFSGFSNRREMAVVEHNGELYIIGGSTIADNSVTTAEVYKTTKEDFPVFAPVTQSGDVPPARVDAQALSFAGRIYLIGGSPVGVLPNGDSRVADVWSSADGAVWRLETAAPAFGNLSDHIAYVQGVSMFVAAGVDTDGIGLSDKLWASSNGKFWTEVAVAAGNQVFTPRAGAAGVVFDPPAAEALAVLEEVVSQTETVAVDYFSPDSTDNAFYTPADDFVSGGIKPYTYSIAGVESAGSVLDKDDDFNINAQTGALALKQLQASALAGVAVQISVTDSSDPPEEISYKLPVDIIANPVEFAAAPANDATAPNQAALNIAHDHDQTTPAIIGSFLASYSDSIDRGTFTYTVLRPTAPPLTEAELSIGETNGELMLELTQPKLAAFGPVAVTIQAEVKGIAAQTWELMIKFHEQVAFSNLPSERIERTVPPAGVDEVLYTFAASGGTGEYNFHIVDDTGVVIENAGDGAVAFRGAELTQIGVVNTTPRILPLTVRVTDADEALGGRSDDVEIMIRWRALTAVNEDKHLYILGGRSGSSNFGEVYASKLNDESSWQEVSSSIPPRHNFAAAVLNNTIFISGGFFGSGNIFTSDVWASSNDGVSWSRLNGANGNAVNTNSREGHAMVNYKNTLYIIGGRADRTRIALRSTDGKTWNEVAAFDEGIRGRGQHFSGLRDMAAVVHDDSLYIIGGGVGSGRDRTTAVYKYTVADGSATFEDVAQTAGAHPPARYDAQAVSFAGRIYLIGGNLASGNADVWSSADGATWRRETPDGETPAFGDLNSHVAYVQGVSLFVAGGRLGNVASAAVWASSNGKDWVEVSTDTGEPGFSARYNAAAVLYKPRSLVLSDFAVIDPDADLFVVGGDGLSDVWTSSDDGETWTWLTQAAEFGARYEAAVAVLKNTIYVSGGRRSAALNINNDAFNDVWSSSNGVNWSNRGTFLSGFGARRSRHAMLEHRGTLYIMGGLSYDRGYFAQNAVLYWNGAGTWAARTGSPRFTTRHSFAAFSHGKNMFVVGGRTNVNAGQFRDGFYSNEVWSSSDGNKWTAISTLPFGGRANMKGISYKEKIYLSGGYDGTNHHDDVWTSADGKTWQLEPVTDAAAFGDLSAHGVLVAHGDDGTGAGQPEDKMFVLGGSKAGTASDKVWSSADGENWTQRASGAFTARISPGAVASVPGLGLPVPADAVAAADDAGASLFQVTAYSGTPRYTYAIEDVQPADPTDYMANFGINTANGLVTIETALGITEPTEIIIAVKVTDGDGDTALGSVTVNLTPGEQDELTPVNENGRLYILGGLNGSGFSGSHYLGDVVALKQDDENNENSWQELSSLFPERHNHAAAVLGNSIFISGGSESSGGVQKDVWVSADNGVQWSQVEDGSGNSIDIGAREGHAMVNYGGTLHIIGGRRSATALHGSGSGSGEFVIWSSSDGTTWTEVDPNSVAEAAKRLSPRDDMAVVVHNDELYVIGGRIDGEGADAGRKLRTTEVYKTTTTEFPAFTELTQVDAPYARAGAQAVSFNGRIYLIGGDLISEDGDADVWSSADGGTWNQETAAPAFGDLQDHIAYVQGLSMFVATGRAGGDNDPSAPATFSSSDGVTWTPLDIPDGSAAGEDDARYSERYNAAGVVYEPRDIIAVSGPASNVVGAPAQVDNPVLTITVTISGFGNPVFTVTPSSAEEDFSFATNFSFDDTAKGILVTVRQKRAVALARTIPFRIVATDDLGSAELATEIVWQEDATEYAAIAPGAHLYVVGGDGLSDVWVSADDGENWRQLAESLFADGKARSGAAVAVQLNKIYVSGGDSGSGVSDGIRVSDNGMDWEDVDHSGSFPARKGHAMVLLPGFGFGGLLVIGGQDVDAANAVRYLNDIWTSVTGAETWIPSPPVAGFSGRSDFVALVHDSRLFVMGGDTGDTEYSKEVWSADSDGINAGSWSPGADLPFTPTAGSFNALSFKGRIYLTEGNDVWVSVDGADWELVTDEDNGAEFGDISGHGMVAQGDKRSGDTGNKMFVLAGNAVWSSSTGELWTERTASTAAEKKFSTRTNPAVVAISVALALPPPPMQNGVFYSPAPHTTETELFTVAAIGGVGNYSYEIVDGNANIGIGADDGRVSIKLQVEDTATQVEITIRVTDKNADDTVAGTAEITLIVNLSSPLQAERVLIIGGLDSTGEKNDVWSSDDDGETWDPVAAGQRFSARSGHAVAESRGTVYISGGTDGTNHLDEFWYSDDGGANWTQRTAAEGERFPARAHHKMLFHNNTLFIIGGLDGDGNILNDVWVSADGASWTKSGTQSGVTPLDNNRNTFMAFVYDDRLLVAAGRDIVENPVGDANRDNRAMRAYNNKNTPDDVTDDTWDTVQEDDIPALPQPLYVTISEARATTPGQGAAPLSPHNANGVADGVTEVTYSGIGAAGAVFNGSIFIYARNHIWSYPNTDVNDGSIIWEQAANERLPYAYGYNEANERQEQNFHRQVGHQPAVSQSGADAYMLLIGGVLDDDNAAASFSDRVWRSADGSDWGDVNNPTANLVAQDRFSARIGHAVTAHRPLRNPSP